MTINIKQARDFLTLLTGSDSTPVTWQVFYDPKGEAQRPDLAKHWVGTLDENLEFLTWANQNLCGVYVGINQTDGLGRENSNVIGYRGLFADFDGMEQPEWQLTPHFIQKRDNTHGHAFWLVSDITEADEFRCLQKRIAICCGTDKQVHDPARVIRVAGFTHWKNPNAPAQYMITDDNTEGEHKYTKADIEAAFPLTALQDAELNAWVASRGGLVGGTGYVENERYNEQYKNWVTNTAPPAILGEGSFTLFRVAAYAHDYGIPFETAKAIAWEYYNPRCEPPWLPHEANQFSDIMERGYLYATSEAGCKTATANFTRAGAIPESIGGREANKSLAKPELGIYDYLTPLPNLKKNFKPIRTYENLAEICKRLGVTIRYNVIAKSEEIIIPNMGFTKDNAANASLSWLKSEAAKFEYNSDWVDGFITYLAELNKFNPVINWIESKDWDGEDRLKLLLETVTSDGNEDLKNILITKWLVSAVHAAYSLDGISAQGILVFQGDQSLGKTRWFNNLVPKELNLTKDGFLLKPDDKDSVKQACSFWLVELGEIDSTFRKSDIAALKAFITTDMDVFRNPYAKKESHYARRTVFFGSVNPSEFLADETGNRRYWTISCKSINHSHTINMQQVWAQVKSLAKDDSSYYLNESELLLLNKNNEDHSSSSPIEDLIFTHLDWQASKDKWEMLTATKILNLVGFSKPNKREVTEVSSIIKKNNGNNVKRTGKGRFLLTPPLKNINHHHHHL